MQGFFCCHRRQYAGHGFGQRTFAGAGRAYQDYVVTSGRCNLYPALRTFLADDFGKVHYILSGFRPADMSLGG